MTCTSQQVGALMRASHFYTVGEAAQIAGMSASTARKYIKAGGLIVVREPMRREGQGAFTGVWPVIEERLKKEPELQSRKLLDWLINEYPGQFQPKQLRTLQRYVEEWRYLYGPDKEMWFEQTDGPPIRSGRPEQRNSTK
jgi:hypothetical protein